MLLKQKPIYIYLSGSRRRGASPPPQLPSGKERGLELGGKMEKNNGGCANKAVGLGWAGRAAAAAISLLVWFVFTHNSTC